MDFNTAVQNFAMGITQPFRQGLINPVAALVQSGAGMATDLRNGKTLMDALANPANDVLRQKPFGVTPQENADYMGNPAIGGLKSGVGIGSYAIPAAGSGLFPAASMSSAIGSGALIGGASGGAFGFGTSRPGEEIPAFLNGVGTGAVTGGALSGLMYGLNSPGGNARINSNLHTPSDPMPTDPSMLNTFNDMLRSKGLTDVMGGTGPMGEVNPALNYLMGGNSTITNTLNQSGFRPSQQELSQLALEVLKSGKVPTFMQSTLQNYIK